MRSISADDPINMLVQDPDKFFGRTTKARSPLLSPPSPPSRRRGILSQPVSSHIPRPQDLRHPCRLLASCTHARRRPCCSPAAQALNVNAESDGRGAQRTLSSPMHTQHLALPWPAILGICLGGLLVMGLTAAVFARRHTRRAYQVMEATAGCRSCRQPVSQMCPCSLRCLSSSTAMVR